MSQLERIVKEEKLLLALDRDGTLVPYAANPQDAVMSAAVQSLLSQLADRKGITVAIVSARSVAQLEEDIDHEQVILAGNYGLQIKFPGNEFFVNPEAIKAVPELQRIKEQLQEIGNMAPNSVVEDQIYSLHFHFRNVPKEFLSVVHNQVQSLEKQLKMTQLNPLPTSYEFFPQLIWDKGKAMDAIQKHLGLVKGEFFPIFIGDTEKDEPALAWANRYGGFSLRVAPHQVSTQAQEVLENTDGVIAFLQALLRAKTKAGTPN
jgi:trehalose-phosphatase